MVSSLMATAGLLEHEGALAWQQQRAPVVAAGVALAAWLLGRLLRAAWLQAAAAGLSLCAGWALALGGLALAPHGPAERLPMLALVALALGLAADLAGRAAVLAEIVLAIASGWWLAGAPRFHAEALPPLLSMAGLALGLLVALRLLRAPSGPWSICAAALALWGALVVTGVPALWAGLALVLLAASLGQLAAPGAAAVVRLPMAAGLAGLAGLALLVLGRLGRGGVSRVDLVALAPLLALWAMPRLAARLPWAGGVAAALAAASLAVGVVWGGGRILLAH